MLPVSPLSVTDLLWLVPSTIMSFPCYDCKAAPRTPDEDLTPIYIQGGQPAGLSSVTVNDALCYDRIFVIIRALRCCYP
jgi:hypothetical protein